MDFIISEQAAQKPETTSNEPERSPIFLPPVSALGSRDQRDCSVKLFPEIAVFIEVSTSARGLGLFRQSNPMSQLSSLMQDIPSRYFSVLKPKR